MMKLCPACEKLHIDANYIIEPEEEIPEGYGKCDCCRRNHRWVKAVRVIYKPGNAAEAINQFGTAANEATASFKAFSRAAKEASEKAK